MLTPEDHSRAVRDILHARVQDARTSSSYPELSKELQAARAHIRELQAMLARVQAERDIERRALRAWVEDWQRQQQQLDELSP